MGGQPLAFTPKGMENDCIHFDYALGKPAKAFHNLPTLALEKFFKNVKFVDLMLVSCVFRK